MNDAISKAIEAMDMARSAVGPFAVVVTRKLTESINALQALQSGEAVGVIDNSMRAGVQLTEAGESLPHGTKLYTTPQPVVPEWISVDERLPEEETPVLAIVDGYDGLLTVERRWERCDQMTEPYYKDFLYWDWVDNDGQDLEGKVRFWMRLPEMPALLSAGKGGE